VSASASQCSALPPEEAAGCDIPDCGPEPMQMSETGRSVHVKNFLCQAKTQKGVYLFEI